ncbi:MAG: phosphate ABC transporter substrate-binding protein, partial [Oscillospiraceae bacterium]|nr:phosphate ABC transporter substrate-binding protein [Oscillospiraceae bacterium]
MKRILSIVCAVLVLVLALSACGGKKSSFDSSKNISVITREDGSGTKSAFMELIGLKGKADPENVIIQTGTAGVLTEVTNNPTALAYESLGYVTGDVKALKVEGVEATAANIK